MAIGAKEAALRRQREAKALGRNQRTAGRRLPPEPIEKVITHSEMDRALARSSKSGGKINATPSGSGKRGRPAGPKRTPVLVLLEEDLLERVDGFKAAAEHPSRQEAIRELLERGLSK